MGAFMKSSITKSRKTLLALLGVFLFLAVSVALSAVPVQKAYAVEGPVVLSNVKFYRPDTNEVMPVSMSADGKTLTANNTLGYDFEGGGNVNSMKWSFNVNYERVAAFYSPTSFQQGGVLDHSYNGYLSSFFPTVSPYATDPDYVIAKITLYEVDMTGAKTGKQWGPVLSTKTEFTLRLKKWEKQYKREVSSRWFNTEMWVGQHSSGTYWKSATRLTSSRFAAVKGQSNTYEYVAAKNVKLPYKLDVQVTPYYRTTAYINGVRFTAAEAATRFLRELTFTAARPYVDFKIVPDADLDTKYVDYVTTTWRLRVTPAPAPKTVTKSQFTYSLAAKAFTNRAQGVTVRPKTGAGKVSAVYYTGTAGTSYRKSKTKPKAVGSYAVTADVAAGSAYKAGKGLKLGTFKILPSKGLVYSATAGKRQMTVKWRKPVSTQKITGYRLQYRVKGTSKWTAKVFKASTSSVTIKGLKKGKTYEVVVRHYKKVSRTTYYGSWSSVKRSRAIR